MRTGLFAITAMLFAASQAPAADPPLPPLTFQTQPLGQVLDNMRFAADLVGGEKGVKAFTKELKSVFGEKGLDGVDLTRPIVGYAFLDSPKLEQATVVVALPVTDEKEFLTMCDRINKEKYKVDAKDKTLYHLPPLDPPFKAMMRFSERYAYIAYGKNPAAYIDAKTLVSIAKLHDPADRALMTGRLYFDRDPFGSKVASWIGVSLLNDTLRDFSRGFFWLGGFGEIGRSLADGIEKTAFRVLLHGGADTFTARISMDPATGNIVGEATLTPKPNTQLAKDIAAFKLSPNRFASLTNHPDTAAAFHGRLPLFTSEIRNSFVALLEKGQKENDARGRQEKGMLEELLRGAIRTVKEGDLDVAVAVRGPHKDGSFTAIGGISFDDAATMEKEIKAFFDKSAPPEIKECMKWDADKLGKIAIHTFSFPEKGPGPITKAFGGAQCTGAFAFAPHGVIGVMSADPVPVLKEVLAAKPADAPWVEVVTNGGRIVKLFEKIGGPNDRETNEVRNLFGKDDTKLQALSSTFEGGKELKATVTINLRVLPRIFLSRDIERANRDPAEKAVPPAPFEK
ncbi:MAG: hypothetical protein K8U57_25970 [Planctomycetes bacterium]|nr:hypothetical protein [Planctomycetota bacterium]